MWIECTQWAYEKYKLSLSWCTPWNSEEANICMFCDYAVMHHKWGKKIRKTKKYFEEANWTNQPNKSVYLYIQNTKMHISQARFRSLSLSKRTDLIWFSLFPDSRVVVSFSLSILYLNFIHRLVCRKKNISLCVVFSQRFCVYSWYDDFVEFFFVVASFSSSASSFLFIWFRPILRCSIESNKKVV